MNGKPVDAMFVVVSQNRPPSDIARDIRLGAP
jgi:hypothetical protein